MPFMFRWPWTLWRHYILDLVKLLALTAGVLVTVIAFGGSVKPISDGMLQAADAVKFVLLSIPPMLAYAIPFAGGFAATLVYHRIASDLEAIAAYAGGISHRVLLAPALALAIFCGLSLVALTEQIIPRFLQRMAQMVTVDVVKLITRQLERGQSAVFSDVMIYADGARTITPEPSSDALAQLYMTRFGAIELDAEGLPSTEVTAGAAKLWLLPADTGNDTEDTGRTKVILQLDDVVAVKQGGGIGAFDDTRVTWTVPNTFRHRVKYLTWRELAEIRDHPERVNWIEPKRRALVYALAERQAARDIIDNIRTKGVFDFVDANGQRVTLRAADLVWEDGKWSITPTREGLFEVRMVRVLGVDDAGTPTSTSPIVIAAPKGYLSVDPGEDAVARRVHFRIALEQAKVREAASPVFGPERPTMNIADLTPAQNPATAMLAMSVPQLLESAQPYIERAEPDAEIRDRVHGRDGIIGALTSLDRQVRAKRHERLAVATSGFVMVLCGAVTALKFSRRLPLTVYLFSFFPALATMVTISGGQQAAVKQGAPGLLLMWSGVAALATYTLVVLLNLRRN